ncbi:hypothetical protein GGR52DRAFT_502433 [Hypoxylon sp. FL1284]|nr:hypothetical protein GGR52DRAFT_502433 [Hypoxylon sp. FL1284]
MFRRLLADHYEVLAPIPIFLLVVLLLLPLVYYMSTEFFGPRRPPDVQIFRPRPPLKQDRTATFTCFRKLPFKLRERIWVLYLEAPQSRCVLLIYDNRPGAYAIDVEKSFRPAIHVCEVGTGRPYYRQNPSVSREVRAIALKLGWQGLPWFDITRDLTHRDIRFSLKTRQPMPVDWNNDLLYIATSSTHTLENLEHARWAPLVRNLAIANFPELSPDQKLCIRTLLMSGMRLDRLYFSNTQGRELPELPGGHLNHYSLLQPNNLFPALPQHVGEDVIRRVRNARTYFDADEVGSMPRRQFGQGVNEARIVFDSTYCVGV